jgi:hypothetical protein
MYLTFIEYAVMSDQCSGFPSYGELIDLYSNCDDAEVLKANFYKLYPDIKIGRADRFDHRLKQIASPAQVSILGECAFIGDDLLRYREKIWNPRIRNCRASDSFPSELLHYGLNEDLLMLVFHQVQNNKKSLAWSLKGIPNKDFYQKLHPYLKKKFSRVTKVSLGKFYIAIDHNLKERRIRADNAYRLIEKLSLMKCACSNELMSYGVDEVTLKCKRNLKECKDQIDNLTTEVSEIKKQLEFSKNQLQATQNILRDVTNQKIILKKQCDAAGRNLKALTKKSAKIHSALTKELEHIMQENCDLSEAVSALENELSVESELPLHDGDFTFKTKDGRRYSPAIRKLYYTLLSEEVSTSKISSIIKNVVSVFNPSIGLDDLKLPGKSCASYMRKNELKSICDAHKSTVLCQDASENKLFKLNTDGTTKAQKKLGAIAVNDVVVSVNELCDGTAESAVDDISRELENLRKVAKSLNLPNSDSINWTIFVSSTSDSAATQKKINRLILERQEADEKHFGAATITTIELIKTFCSMHLGVNLRKAFFSAFSIGSESERHHPVDTLVYEFCKLFSKNSTLEYGCGVSFSDFLSLKSSDNFVPEELSAYYASCLNITLERQVGSRYFVTAANAAKIYFLKEAAVEFFKYTGKNTGNKLEREVLEKLYDGEKLLYLKADSMMFYYVYADLVMLAKSTDLGKSMLDMSVHYFELKKFLDEVEACPEILLNRDSTVFKSEDRLYGNNSKTNHRLHKKSKEIYLKLFDEIHSSETSNLFSILVQGVVNMREKLCTYAKDFLPGGIYWEPCDEHVRAVLSSLKPSNDFCESIFGLNDYLVGAIPNLHSVARSNMVQVKKNKTMQWLNNLSSEEQTTIINFAVDSNVAVEKESKDKKEWLCKMRQEKLVKCHLRQEALKRRIQSEKDELANIHLITSTKELQCVMLSIDSKSTSASKKESEKLKILRDQVQLRKKVLHQDIHITFSLNRKKKTACEIIRELSDYIEQQPLSRFSDFIDDPSKLIGKEIKQRFHLEDSNDFQWYNGKVISYDQSEKLHVIKYEDEDDFCKFDLVLDILSGDLMIK